MGTWRRRSGVGAGDLALALALALVLSASTALGTGAGGGPSAAFVNCVDAADLRIDAPGRPGPPRLRNALAVQARKPKRPRRAPPPSLDEPALGGLRRSQRCTGRVADSDLHWKRQFTRAARRPQRPALPRRRCGSTRSGRPDVSFATKALHATQAVKSAHVAHVERLHGDGLAILHRLPASVVLQSHQNRRS